LAYWERSHIDSYTTLQLEYSGLAHIRWAVIGGDTHGMSLHHRVYSRTILRRLKHAAREQVEPEARVIGVDEWAWSKGQSFGTILVDLEGHRVIDVLAESSADALAAWFAVHQGTTTIARDRHGRYAEGARRAAPCATQVADRFHLVRNLRQAVERELAVHRRDLRVSLLNPTTSPAKREGAAKYEADPSALMGSWSAIGKLTSSSASRS
jgi:transposase